MRRNLLAKSWSCQCYVVTVILLYFLLGTLLYLFYFLIFTSYLLLTAVNRIENVVVDGRLMASRGDHDVVVHVKYLVILDLVDSALDHGILPSGFAVSRGNRVVK